MAIVACKVVRAEPHPNADRLRLYLIEAAPTVEATQIIANLGTVYEAGDVVAAALIGTVLEDGTEIQKMKMRGVLSFGMLLGHTTAAVGTDLTSDFGATHVEVPVDESQGVVEESNWPRYTSLPSFIRVRDEILAVPEVVVLEKIHGVNLRFGFHGSRSFMVGTHTSRIVDSRLDAASWPEGHILHHALRWVAQEQVPRKVARWRTAHPEVKSLAIYGELFGEGCADLHYGVTRPEMRLFGEVALDGKFLGYHDAMHVIGEVFGPYLEGMLAPVLYAGKPSLAVFKRLRDRTSMVALEGGESQLSEGVIIRPTEETYSALTLSRLVAKYKSPLYEERRSLRNVDPETLPAYVDALDLITDCITEERIRHVFARLEASGVRLERNRIREYTDALYHDIRKETVGEWPVSAQGLGEDVLCRWTYDLSAEMVARLVDGRA